ncbi:Cysteine protease atg4 [Neonectria punicea]|uniref:Cysteine protease n=1 Tax=Neonectria punicea TaxID=979145 RepID=A0ABR1GI97_9HYPO
MEAAIANVDLGRYRRIVQMFWDPEPSNDTTQDQPVWCLGRQYKVSDTVPTKVVDSGAHTPPSAPHLASDLFSNLESEVEADQKDASPPPPPPPANAPETPPESISSSFSSSLAYDDPAADGGWPPAFLADFECKFWMTYRSEFEPIPRATNPQATSALSFSMRLKSQLGDQGDFSSDSGWGCMIRSGQSLLANTMAMISLGRDWRRGISVQEERQLVSAFADDPRAPYSIHSFCYCRALANSHEPSLRVYSTGDGPDVYEDEFMKIAKPQGEEFHPTLILVGTRLGIDKITPVYWEALIASLQMHQSVGIAGGRPSSSHYFIGAQGSFLFYLDPHHTRTALPYHEDPNQYTDEEVGTCHTSRLRRIHVREMDPSMLIGFLIRSEEDWRDWRRCVNHVQGKAIIHVADHNPLLGGQAEGRQSAIDEVEPLSDDDADTVHEA